MTNICSEKTYEKADEIRKNKLMLLFCFAISVMLVGSLYFKYLAYIAFFSSILIICFSNTNHIFGFLLFLFPFALIFKTSADSTSLFTFLELFAICVLLVRRKTINVGVFSLTVLLFLVCILSFSNLLEIIKLLLIVTLYFLFTENYKQEDTRLYLSFAVLGLLISTFLGFFKEEIPRFLSFYSDLNYEWIGGEKTIRFSGIFNDPNYFSIAVIQILIISILFLFQEGKKKLLLFTTSVLLVCGLLTISKSFYLMLFAILCVILLGNMKKHFLPVLILISALIVIVIYNPGGVFDQILYRFDSYDIGTGRTEIWYGYIDVIKSSLKNMLVGAGLGAPYVVKAAHSIYIETLYYIGTIGFIIYTITLTFISCYKKIKFRRKLVNYLGFICLAIQYAFLCGITGYEIAFYLMISYMIFNYDWSKIRNKTTMR